MSKECISSLDIEEHYDKAEQLYMMALALELAIFSNEVDFREFQPAVSLLTSLMCDHSKALEALFHAGEAVQT